MQDHQLIPRGLHGVAGAGKLVLVALASLASATAQREPPDPGAQFRIPDPDIAVLIGTWKYQFHSEYPNLSAAVCQEIEDAIKEARQTAPPHAIESMIDEERYLRECRERTNGRPAPTYSVEHRTMAVAEAAVFYQRIDENGGWQVGVADGHTDQVLRLGDILWHRSDPSPASGVSRQFTLETATDKQTADRCLLTGEWRQHALAVHYCLDFGVAAGQGRWVVDKKQFEQRPPYGLSLLYVGTSMALEARRVGKSTRCVVTLFDQNGRTCKEWTSEWLAERPAKLSECEHWSAGAFVNNRRTLTVVSHSRDFRIPDLQELAVTPTENREAFDHRRPGAFIVDPLGKVPSLESLSIEEGGRGDDNPVVPEVEIRAVTDAPPAQLTRLPSATVAEQGQAGRSWPWLLAAAVAVILVVVIRRARAAFVMLCVVGLASCSRSAPAAPAAPGPVALQQAVLDVTPDVVRLARRHPGERRRLLFACLNCQEAPIEAACILPSCGCLVTDFEPRRVDGFDGFEFSVLVDMDRFIDADLDMTWRSCDGKSSGVVKVRLRHQAG
jgi:hypothetical protein